MMLMMLVKGASIISIIGGSFLQSEAFRHPPDLQILLPERRWPRGLVFKTPVLMMLFWGVLRTPESFKNPFVAGGFASNVCQSRLSFGAGSGERFGETEVQ